MVIQSQEGFFLLALPRGVSSSKESYHLNSKHKCPRPDVCHSVKGFGSLTDFSALQAISGEHIMILLLSLICLYDAEVMGGRRVPVTP